MSLKEKYDKMHAQGPSAWFGQGHEERLTILQAGWPWAGKDVLEIGCGEGDLAAMMSSLGAKVVGFDYSEKAIEKFRQKYPSLRAFEHDYKNIYSDFQYDRIIMQGVLEHLEDPFKELKWMADNLLKEHGDIITSSPNFVNTRGVVWMVLSLLFNVPMSLTDRNFINPVEFNRFVMDNDYKMTCMSCDVSWGWGEDMIEDFKQRLPKALADAKMNTVGVPKLLKWLDTNIPIMLPSGNVHGGTIVYRIMT